MRSYEKHCGVPRGWALVSVLCCLAVLPTTARAAGRLPLEAPSAAPAPAPQVAGPSPAPAPAAAAAPTCSGIDVQMAAELVQSGQSSIIDVRTAEEFAAGHPEGAVNVPAFFEQGGTRVPNPRFLEQVEQAAPDKAVPLVLGCASGRRSLAACELMAAAGYTSLLNMEGGFQEWASAGLPVAQ